MNKGRGKDVVTRQKEKNKAESQTPIPGGYP